MTKYTYKTVTIDGSHRIRCIPWYDVSTGRCRVRVTYIGLKKGVHDVYDLREEIMNPHRRTLDTVYTIENSANKDEAVAKAVELFMKDNGI